MTRDGRNDLELKYNFLNLLSEVKHISWGDDACVEYKWSADGMKLSTDMPSHAVDNIYLGSLVYYHWDNELRLESTGFSSGRIFASDTGTGMSHTPTYFITDHIGSTRAVIQLDGENIEVLERNDYYPFGLRWDTASSPLTDNRYTFSGKEEQYSLFNIPYLDFGFRMYDPFIARWTTPDPLAEMYTSFSPYNYCLNNTVRYIDPFGLEPVRHGGGVTDLDTGEGVIDPIVITGRRPSGWGISLLSMDFGMNWPDSSSGRRDPGYLLMFARDLNQPGGGSGGSHRSSSGSESRPAPEPPTPVETKLPEVEQLLKNMFEQVRNANDIAEAAVEIGKIYSDNQDLVKIGRTTSIVGLGFTAIDFLLLYDAVIQGKPSDVHFKNLLTGVISQAGLPGMVMGKFIEYGIPYIATWMAGGIYTGTQRVGNDIMQYGHGSWGY